MPTLKRALTDLRNGEFSAEEQLECGLLTYYAAVNLWDDESWEVLCNRHVQLCRDAGALKLIQQMR